MLLTPVSSRRPAALDHGPARPTCVVTLGSLFAVLGLLVPAGLFGCGQDTGLMLDRGNVSYIAIGVIDSVIQGRQNGDFTRLPDLFGGLASPTSPTSPALAGSGGEPEPPVICEAGSYLESADGTRIDFDDCSVDGCVIDGGANFTVSEDLDAISVGFDDFRGICDDGQEIHIGDSTITCSGLLELAPVCEIELDTARDFDFIGRHSGDPLEIDDLEVQQLDTGFYTYSGSLYYPGFGRVWFESVTDVGFTSCPGDVPVSGEVEIVGSIQGVKANVMFLGCDWFSVCFDDGIEEVERCDAYLWRDVMAAEQDGATP